MFAAIVCSNGWDGVTAALQLLSLLDGDALNVALLMPELQRVIPGVLMTSLSEHYSSPWRLAEYKRQFRRAFRRPDDDPSIFAVELETLARRTFSDTDSSIQLQMVRDRFIDGQAECALRQHLDSFGPNTPMQNIVDSYRVWESHNEAGVRRHDGSGRNSPAGSTESETLHKIMRRLLPTPTVSHPKVAHVPSDRELLVQRLLGVIRSPQPVVQERSQLTDMEIALQNLLLVGLVVEEDGPSSEPLAESLAGCFSCGMLTHETDRCQELDESFPFLPVGWQAGEGLVTRISNDCRPQLPVGEEDIPGPAVSDYLGAVRTLRKVEQRAPVVGRGVRSPCSKSDDDVLSVGPMRPLLSAAPLGGAIGHDDYRIWDDSLRDEWSVDSWTAGDHYGTSCVQLDNFDWVMPAGYPVGVLPKPEEDDNLSDIEPDVCDVPDVLPVRGETAAVEPLCFPVVVPTRSQGVVTLSCPCPGPDGSPPLGC